ncbi:thioredoxin fold domain-containing protein [Flavobacterium sp. Root186]|uniref:thioredoxin family protein n=1 Tax=Flavobacterium sp. Root186 TaxID=1736485 RepID=UPI0006FB48F8|nr:thioredoxin fold domain-containing protein [Flavobacterium sp. Root186]KRB57503.1 thioredoxin [Flavobacterium sp. Root186]
MKNLKNGSGIISFYFFLFSMFCALNAGAQKKATGNEINFISKNYQQALTMAKASHKKIFVDAYAVWCAPCKQLQKTTFKDSKAAAYFNKNYINFSIDVEKGEGTALAKSWGIEGLPTLLILDQNGKVIASHIGYVDGAGLLEFTKEASGQ